MGTREHEHVHLIAHPTALYKQYNAEVSHACMGNREHQGAYGNTSEATNGSETCACP